MLDQGHSLGALANQQPSGLFAANGGHEMYQHGISTLMLAEVFGMTDAALGKELKPKLEKGVQLILRAKKRPPLPIEAAGATRSIAMTRT